MKQEKENSVIINLIGTGCKICIIRPDDVLFEKLKQTASLMKMPLESAILDNDFFNFLADEKLKSIKDLSDQIIRGLLNSTHAQIEVRISGKKKRRILLSELLDDNLLLPLYNVKLQSPAEIAPGSLLIIEKETGLVAGTKLFIDKLNLEKMDFEFIEVDTGIEKLILLYRICYEGQKINPTVKDTLVTSNYATFKK